jgi:cytochrome d ubiquinol oxidase subunit II
MSLDLPLVWAGIIALAVLFYVLLDGFDLGVGILFPFARSPAERDAMMASIAPVWDGNETWLVLGGGGLFAAFPVAYAVLLPALYLPIYLMLIALILRGVAFEFRVRGRRRGKQAWTIAFAAGSTIAAFAQGLVLGGFIQGVRTRSGAFAGGPFDWLTPYAVFVAAGLVAGYALLGAGWLIWKTEGRLHQDARRWAARAGVAVAVLLALVSLLTLKLDVRIAERWGLFGGRLDWPTAMRVAPIPMLGVLGLLTISLGLRRGPHGLPYAGAVLVFLSGYLGLAISFFPYVVPYSIDFRQAASTDDALALLLAGAGIMLPLILAYSGYVYWLFRGKVGHGEGYH